MKADDHTISRVKTQQEWLKAVFDDFSVDDGNRVKDIEKVTNHDVKAIEYFLKEKFEQNSQLKDLKEYLHFSCTSEDINNLAYALMIHRSMQDVVLPQLRTLYDALELLAFELADTPMMSRTHGQSATPTTMGKEIANFAYRLKLQIRHLERITPSGKFNGAVGNLNAHIVAYPDLDWIEISRKFVEGMGITWNPYTTQIEPHDTIAELSLCLSHTNTILIDFSRDMWHYISLGYFK